MSYFESLPSELICAVAESLCLHCNAPRGCQCGEGCLGIDPYRDPEGYPEDPEPDSCFPEYSPSEIRTRIRALASLCRTSRRFHVAATPHLYHRPDTERWWLLARTLLNHPHLADHVRRLCVGDGIWFSDNPKPAMVNQADIPPEVWAYYGDRLEEARETAFSYVGYPDLRDVFNMDIGDDDDNDSHSNDYNNVYSNLSPLSYTVEEVNDERAALLATLCPATVVLEAVVSWPPICYLSTPGSLPQLTVVELVNYCPLEGFTLFQLAALFRAAPNLRTVRCQRLWDPGKYGNGLDGVVSTSACPCLETFRFGSRPGSFYVGEEQFHPLQARDTMFKFGTSLKKVEMDLECCRVWWRPFDHDPNLWHPGQLKPWEIEAFTRSFSEHGISLEMKLPLPKPRFSYFLH
ncbi:hypothetical protein VTH82DRAFT_3234 [Thermothelomyces myriococcoides]